MKIVVIHGENAKQSRARFAKIVSGVKSKGWEVNFLSPSAKYTIGDSLMNTTIFESQTLHVIEEAKKLKPTDYDWISNNSSDFDSQLLIYSLSKISASNLKKLGKSAKVEEFSPPKILFTFLDSLFPGNGKRSLLLLEDLLETQPIELVIAMMARHLRDLYWVMLGGQGMNYPDWRKNKLGHQSARYTKLELADIINNLASIDLKSKTSKVNTKLLLEMLIIKKLG